MIDPQLIPQVAARFRALADEARLGLLSVLQGGESTVGELARATGRSQPNVSQHLASLTRAGLVGARRDGTRSFYRITDPTVMRICDAVCESLGAPPRRGRRPATQRRRTGGER